MSLSYLDDLALAGAALGFSEEETDEKMDSGFDFEDAIYNKFDVDLETFSKIASTLLLLTPTVRSPLSGSLSHAFVRNLGEGKYTAIIKKDATEE
tara:strand:+ start:7228 stop:7512 length:285 start_codon:yes stop_codon:yes gene_type:complete